MPFSWTNKNLILDLIKKKIQKDNLKEISILDLGIGWGNVGKLLKEKIPIKTSITGVEIWTKNKTDKWNYYDQIVIDDIRGYIPKEQKKYDIVLLLDVLEHFNRNDGEKVLRRVRGVVKRMLILSTPLTNYKQILIGYPYEKHRFIWSEKELIKFGLKKIGISLFPVISPPFYAKTATFALEK